MIKYNFNLRESSLTSSAGASGRVTSLYGSQLSRNHNLKNSLSIFSGSSSAAKRDSYESLIQYRLESGVCAC
jgi:hypothetical protein